MSSISVIVRGLLLVVFGSVGGFAMSGCGTQPPASPAAPPPPQSEERITGNERLGWDQQAAGTAELATFRYAAYVDGTRSELIDVSCGSTLGTLGFPCSARLPSMSPGSHAIELASFVIDGSVLESGRSSPIRVNVTGATMTAGTADWAGSALVTTVDRLHLRVELVTGGLEDPTDLAIAPDGRVFVAERAGHVQVVWEDRLQRARAPGLDDVTTADGGGLVAIALDPRFQRTGLVYLIYTARSRANAPVFRLARFREVAGTLGERAILLDGIPAGRGASASLRFGKDGKLYAAFDDGGDAALRKTLASFNGKILRLNPDGTTPRDNVPSTPIHAYGFGSPGGLDWHPATNTLWMADRVEDGTSRVSAIVAGDNRSTRGAAGSSYRLPPSSDAVALAFYHGSLLPAFESDLLIAIEAGHILRVRLDGNLPPRVVTTERLLDDRAGPMHAIGVGPRGEIYFATDEALGRLVPSQP